LKINRKLLAEIKGGAELFGAMLEMETTKTLLEGHIHDLEIELKSSKEALRSTKKRMKKGAEAYESIHNKSIHLEWPQIKKR
jgi:hypothetical protein